MCDFPGKKKNWHMESILKSIFLFFLSVYFIIFTGCAHNSMDHTFYSSADRENINQPSMLDAYKSLLIKCKTKAFFHAVYLASPSAGRNHRKEKP